MPEFDSTAPTRRGVVAVVLRDDRLLVIRRSAQVVAPGAYCFPGGGIEAGETEHGALVREFHEELGVVVRPLKKLWQSVTPWRVDLSWWLGEIDPSAPLLPNPAEVESVHWHTVEEMRRLSGLLASNLAFLEALAEGAFDLGDAAPI